MTITASIDLRNTHGQVRHQGDRRTCLAFAMSDLNGNRHLQPAQLSPEHLYREAAALVPGWKPHGGLTIDAALKAVSAPGQALEITVPYATKEPTVPLAPNPSCKPLFAGRYALHSPVMIAIQVALAANRSMGLVLRVTPDFYNVSADAPQIPYSPHAFPNELHAVLVVGMGTDNGTSESFVLIRNSWGPDWADNGHAWLPESYVLNHTLYAFGD